MTDMIHEQTAASSDASSDPWAGIPDSELPKVRERPRNGATGVCPCGRPVHFVCGDFSGRCPELGVWYHEDHQPCLNTEPSPREIARDDRLYWTGLYAGEDA